MRIFFSLLTATFMIFFSLTSNGHCNEGSVKEGILSDLETPYVYEQDPKRVLLNGKMVADSPDYSELWIDFDCSYCKPVTLPASTNVLLRHNGESNSSLHKSLIFEALLSINADLAFQFWQDIFTQSDTDNVADTFLTTQVLQKILVDNKLDPQDFSDRISTLGGVSQTVRDDILTAKDKGILYTPTWVINGVRLQACDFNGQEFTEAQELVLKAKSGDKEAIDSLITLAIKEFLED